MSTLDDARAIATALPHVEESVSHDGAMWKVAGRSFVWERGLRKADLIALDQVPEGPFLGAYVNDEAEKQALVQGEPELFFTTPHFDGYAMVLVRLSAIDGTRLREVIEEAWRIRAPRRLGGLP